MTGEWFENLDGMDADELKAYARALRHAMSRERSRIMRGVLRKLISYAALKAEALYEFGEGNLLMGGGLTDAADRVYHTLPKFARW